MATHWREWGLLVPATGLWVVGVSNIDASRMNDLGLVSVVPAPTLIGLGLLAISFTIALRNGASEGVLAFHVALTVVALSAIAPLAESQPRFDVTYRHVGIADTIARTGMINPHVDAYFNWPGFFALSAALTRAIGASSPLVVTEWSPLVLGLAYLAPLVIIFRTATRDRRLVWLAAWFFTLANWIGQDYWSPQGLGFFLMLAALAGCLLVLRREQARTQGWVSSILRFLPRLAGPLRRPVGRFFRAGATAPKPRTRPPSSITTRVGVYFVVLLIAASVIAGHQLTPFALLAVTIGLVLTGRLSTRSLPLILIVGISVWLMFPASTYVDGHLRALTGQVGNVGGAVGANLTGRLGGSHLHTLVVQERLLFAGGVWFLALLGGLRRLRRGHRDADLAVIALAPFPLLPLQPLRRRDAASRLHVRAPRHGVLRGCRAAALDQGAARLVHARGARLHRAHAERRLPDRALRQRALRRLHEPGGSGRPPAVREGAAPVRARGGDGRPAVEVHPLRRLPLQPRRRHALVPAARDQAGLELEPRAHVDPRGHEGARQARRLPDPDAQPAGLRRAARRDAPERHVAPRRRRAAAARFPDRLPQPGRRDLQVHGATRMTDRRLSPAGVILFASTVVSLLALLPHVPVPVRAILIVTFALVCPGFAWVRLLGLEDRLAEWTLGVAASIAIGTLVASLQAYAGAWSPAGTIILLALVVLAAIATELVASTRRPRGQEAR